MDLVMPQLFDRIKAASGELVRCTLVNIGDWNMDLNGGVSVPHGIADPNKIISVTGWLRNDPDTARFPIPCAPQGEGGHIEVGPAIIQGVNIVLYRMLAGGFDSAFYDSVGYNRGQLFIWYIE